VQRGITPAPTDVLIDVDNVDPTAEESPPLQPAFLLSTCVCGCQFSSPVSASPANRDDADVDDSGDETSHSEPPNYFLRGQQRHYDRQRQARDDEQTS
jgi:hypothetical protein